MSKKPAKKSLSQGLSSVLGTSTKTRAADIFFGGKADETARFAELKIADIVPNKNQPRTHFDEEAMNELVHSIKNIGQLQPIVVRALGDDTYELIMGERRLRASKIAGKSTVSAVIRTTDDENMLRDALLENIHRSDLNALEEAAAYEQMIQDFSITQQELSTRIGRSRSRIANTLRLLKLPASLQKLVHEGTLSAGHARALVGVKDEKRMLSLADTCLKEEWSVRELEAKIAANDAGTSVKHRAQKSQKMVELSSRLTQKFKVPATVTQKGDAGKITFEYASQAELQKLLKLLK